MRISPELKAMSETAIKAEGLGKQYRIGLREDMTRNFREVLTGLITAPIRRFNRLREKSTGDDLFWAVRDASFEIRRGEVIGIIGRNGSGKSTLLKMLSRITDPTAGRAEIHGRVGSLLEVGTGFHPELSGRENIYLNGAILGMKKAEIDAKFDEIASFAEVEKFLDTPVKRYSSGMRVRLGFAVAAHLEPDILIVDEVLAVGDASFQKKCLGKMDSVAKEGRTVLLVSHNMGIITSLAKRVILLDRGSIRFIGEATEAVAFYMGDRAQKGGVDLRSHPNRLVGMTPALISARITDAKGNEKEVFFAGDDWYLELEYACEDHVKLAGAGTNIQTNTGQRIGTLCTYMCSPPPFRIPSKGKIRFHIPNLRLYPGTYSVSVAIGTHPKALYDKVDPALTFSVEPTDIYGTGYIVKPSWGIWAFDGSYEILE